MLVGAPLVEAEQDSSIGIEDLPKVIMGRRDSRLTEQRLIPFQAARHVAYPYDRPRALNRATPLRTNSCLDRPRYNPVMDGLKRSSRRQPILFILASTISQNLPYCFLPTGGPG